MFNKLSNIVCMLSCVQLFATPRTVAHQAPLSMEFSRQEYSSGLPFPSPGDLPDPGIKLTSAALADRFFTTGATWEAQCKNNLLHCYSIYALQFCKTQS